MAQDGNEKKTKDYIRPPIVTFMGHVDHGKTSILDAIRHTSVQEGEYGGITQHIGAYQIIHNSQKITFIDTPGHEAFTQMRSRGGRAADIVVLVVASEEGVKPQTKEAIAHIKAAGVPLIVAINKIDKPGSDPRKVKQELASENILVEDWGGDVVSVEISAKTGHNLDSLLDAIIAVYELNPHKADIDGELEMIIIESRLDKKRGVVVSGIVRNGTIRIGDNVVASHKPAKVKSIVDDKGVPIKFAGPSDPVEILGFKDLPSVGDLIVSKGSDLEELSEDEHKAEIIGKDAKRTVTIVLKADTQGTLEAVKASLAALITSSVDATYAIKFLQCSTGDITESDVMLAQSADGIVIGFNVIVRPNIFDFARSVDVVVKTYKTIYELIDEAKDLLEVTATKEELRIKGRARILKLFKLPSGDVVAGCEVVAGALKPNTRVNIFDKNPADIEEDEEPLYTGSIKHLRVGREEVKVVGKNNECGILLKPPYEDLAKEQWLEVI